MWKEKRALPDDGRKYDCVHYNADGTGGIIITWILEKESGVYSNARARKLYASGDMKWSEPGVPIFDISGTVYQKIDTVLNDRSGGVIVVGILGNSALRGDMIYAQRLDTEGNSVWGGGIRVDR